MRLTALFTFLLLLLPFTSQAATSHWQQSDEASVRLISAQNATGEETEILFGLQIQMLGGWHTYWRTPGETGLPPRIDWTGSQNLASSEILYPAPLRFEAAGIQSVGYNGNVILPLKIRLKEANKPINLNAKVSLLFCDELCVPRQFDVKLSLPTGIAKRSAEASLIYKFFKKVPSYQADTISLSEIERTNKGISLILQTKNKLDKPDIFLETKRDMAFKKPKIGTSPDGHTAHISLDLVEPLPQGQSLQNTDVTITIVNGEDSFEQHFPAGVASNGEDNGKGETPALPFLILIAILGGFILNLMPCVLPVLSLKIMGLIRHSGRAHHAVRRAFLSTAAGILFSFILLALLTIALKAMGMTIGWGFQFQHPIFLVFMIALLTFFAANLWGLFEIRLPEEISELVDPHKHPRLRSDFATGALATLLATPCTAPFLGTAVAFALASGPQEILVIFFALGLGMSLPYLAIALFPRFASKLPQPGAWMLHLSRFLGLCLAGTALWLLTVLTMQMGDIATAFVALAMLVILGQLFLRHKNKCRDFTRPVLAASLIFAFALALLASTPSVHSTYNTDWAPFDEEVLTTHLLKGETVFVNVTADWCMTCKFNKSYALDDEDVKMRLLKDEHVLAMQADWTNPDPVIEAFLHKYGRYGVPFNIVYGPYAPDGVLLPELLTPSIVLTALDEAQSSDKIDNVDEDSAEGMD